MKKNLFAYTLITLGLLAGLTSYTLAQVSPGVGLFKKTGDTVRPLSDDWDLGVATSTASADFAVQGNSYTSGTTTTAKLRIASSTAALCDLKADGGGTVYCGTDATGTTIDAAQLSKFATSSVDAEAIYTANATKLGVGSSTPSTNLSIQGNALIAGTTTVRSLRATSTIRLGDEEVNSWSGTGLLISGGILNVPAGTCITANANDIAVTTNCTDAATVDGFEGAGFLRSNASDEFETGNTLTLTGTLDSNGAVSFADTTVLWDGATTDFTFIGDFTANTNQLTLVKATGLFGIATATPRATLSVNGNVQVSGTTTTGGLVASTTLEVTTGRMLLNGVDYIWPTADGSNAQILSTNANGVLSWATDATGGGGSSIANTALMSKFATSTANANAIYTALAASLGVGTSTPSTNLSVQGNALISGTSTVGILRATSSLIFNLAIDPDGSLRIPFGAAPVTTTAGRLALDTTDNQLLLSTSTTGNGAVFGRVPTLLYAGRVSAPTTTVIGLGVEKDGFTAYFVLCSVWGGTSVGFNLTDDGGDNDTNTVTCNTTTSTQRALVGVNNTWTAAEGASIELSAVTGIVDFLHYSIWGVITRE